MANPFFWVTPNQLTLLRILSIPLLLWMTALHDPVMGEWALLVFFLSSLTDFFDGWLARRWGVVSRLGKLLDPVADKMLILALLVMLVSQQRAEVIPVILIVMREFFVTGLRSVAAAEGVVISSEQGAKVKTVLQMIATGGFLIDHNPAGIPAAEIGRWGLYLATALTLWTGWTYFLKFIRYPKAS
ncbi:MAG: CDP-diacylglycerol--glycerol-3-phosphate 3-phosphatidyltransferase [Deltaproteobacteria bacterium]|nr:CDP-diacylglycerol--glycerol-3-phosphate 3-phosphatidyltransferase [Deltaproteobacteria bacterium]